MLDVMVRWLRSLLGMLGRNPQDFGQEILYFGGSRVWYTHLGCFGIQGGVGGGRRAFMRCQITFFFQIRQAVPGGLARAWFCCWACWARFFLEKKLYYISYNTFTCIPVVFVSRGLGRRRMNPTSTAINGWCRIQTPLPSTTIVLDLNTSEHN